MRQEAGGGGTSKHNAVRSKKADGRTAETRKINITANSLPYTQGKKYNNTISNPNATCNDVEFFR